MHGPCSAAGAKTYLGWSRLRRWRAEVYSLRFGVLLAFFCPALFLDTTPAISIRRSTSCTGDTYEITPDILEPSFSCSLGTAGGIAVRGKWRPSDRNSDTMNNIRVARTIWRGMIPTRTSTQLLRRSIVTETQHSSPPPPPPRKEPSRVVRHT